MIQELKPDENGVYTQKFTNKGSFTAWSYSEARKCNVLSAEACEDDPDVYAIVKYMK